MFRGVACAEYGLGSCRGVTVSVSRDRCGPSPVLLLREPYSWSILTPATLAGEICQRYHDLDIAPVGLFLTPDDAGKIEGILRAAAKVRTDLKVFGTRGVAVSRQPR